MAQKTTNTTKNDTAEIAMETIQASHMSQDLKTAVLIVSVVANLFIFTTWVAMQVTTQYDAQIAGLLFSR